jgi:hypothetical protein
MLRVEFEPTIPVFERAKTVHALDGAATVIGYRLFLCPTNWRSSGIYVYFGCMKFMPKRNNGGYRHRLLNDLVRYGAKLSNIFEYRTASSCNFRLWTISIRLQKSNSTRWPSAPCICRSYSQSSPRSEVRVCLHLSFSGFLYHTCS